ncbi:MAG: hypothetical protein E6J91_10595 [Deltaproteobacteria bacterium]|nr:MAG: hypothetical protein E6J91_10595 [Deltaproteobacteria bacterium]
MNQHGKPPLGTRVAIRIAPDGKARNITLAPETTDAALATCIKGVFRDAAFPQGKDHDLEVTLN